MSTGGEEWFCQCTEFKLWYTTARWRVCECGHPSDEHINDTGTCLGVVEVRTK
jgi:hypothetical protein